MPIIRTARRDEIPTIVEIYKQVGMYDPIATTVERLQTAYDRNPEMLIVAEEGNKVVGSCYILTDGTFAFMFHLCVLPDYQRRGIGTQLDMEMKNRSRKDGCSYADLFVKPDDKATIEFYKKRGWNPLNILVPLTADLKKSESR